MTGQRRGEHDPVFVGIDLAWTPARESGLCIVTGGSASVEVAVLPVARLVERLLDLGTNVVVAIDAPLAVRPGNLAERALGRRFGRYRASPYLATPQFMAKNGFTVGPALGSALSGAGFGWVRPGQSPERPGHWFFETYPHAFHVTRFGLNERILYKKGPLATRRAGTQVLQALLSRALADDLPGLAMPEVLSAPLAGLGGRELKQLEDGLDGVACALAARAAWRDGLAEGDCFGDASEGYIAIPGAARATSAQVPRGP